MTTWTKLLSRVIAESTSSCAFFLSSFDKETTADTRQLLLRDDVYNIMVCVVYLYVLSCE